MKKCRLAIVFAVLAGLLVGAASGSTIQQVTVEEMIAGSELIFEGKVLSSVSRLLPDGSQIRTYVTFEITDLIKGQHANRTIELSFLGGSVGDLSLVVSEMKLPQPGERGVYFVESVIRRQVHPLYGWDQGHFLVTPDERGTDRIRTRDQRKVTAIALRDADRTPALSTGAAAGVRTSRQGAERGLSAIEFKRTLRQFLRASR